MPILQVEIHQSTYEALQHLAERNQEARKAGGSREFLPAMPTPEKVARHILTVLGEGVDRPGSWEHEMLYPLQLMPSLDSY